MSAGHSHGPPLARETCELTMGGEPCTRAPVQRIEFGDGGEVEVCRTHAGRYRRGYRGAGLLAPLLPPGRPRGRARAALREAALAWADASAEDDAAYLRADAALTAAALRFAESILRDRAERENLGRLSRWWQQLVQRVPPSVRLPVEEVLHAA